MTCKYGCWAFSVFAGEGDAKPDDVLYQVAAAEAGVLGAVGLAVDAHRDDQPLRRQDNRGTDFEIAMHPEVLTYKPCVQWYFSFTSVQWSTASMTSAMFRSEIIFKKRAERCYPSVKASFWRDPCRLSSCNASEDKNVTVGPVKTAFIEQVRWGKKSTEPRIHRGRRSFRCCCCCFIFKYFFLKTFLTPSTPVVRAGLSPHQ